MPARAEAAPPRPDALVAAQPSDGGHSARRAGTRLALNVVRGPLLVALAGYTVVLFMLLRMFDFNPTGPIHISDVFEGERFWTESTRLERESAGYDGQYFFYLAHDPLLRDPRPSRFLDLPAYRYARILYPTVVWAFSFGRPEAIPWALLGVNLVAALVGTALAVDILRSLGKSRWLALAYAFSPPILIGLTADLAEPLAFALIAGGIALYLRGRHGWAGLVFAFAALAREVSLLVPLAFAAHAVFRRSWREALASLLPLAMPVAWHLVIWARLGALPSAQTPPNFGAPFSGALYRIGTKVQLQPAIFGEPPTTGDATLEVAGIVLTMALILVSLLKILSRRDVFAVQLWVQALLALFTAPVVWLDVHSHGRVLGLFFLFYGLAALTAPLRVPRQPGPSDVQQPTLEPRARFWARPRECATELRTKPSRRRAPSRWNH